MRKLLILFVLGLSLPVLAQKPAVWQFGLSLASNSSGQLFSLFLVKIRDSSVVETRPLRRLDFIHQAQGREKSPANPDSTDLFLKFKVPSCYLPPDSTAMGYHHSDCVMLDELWKLRFQEFPLQLQSGQREPLGWSGRPLAPSQRQMAILNGYGMRFPKDLVIGENLFRLLHDIGDPQWVTNYRKGA